MKILPAADAAAVPIRAAATTLVLRDGPGRVEVLMVRRSLQAGFMAGAYVFPGGAVDAADHAAGPSPHAVAAARECLEECALRLDPAALVPWSRWTTPLVLPKRFDTMFYFCRAPDGQVARADESETTAIAWVQPSAALDAHGRGEHPMEFATVRTVQSLVPHEGGGVQALLAWAARQPLPVMEPRLHLEDGRLRGVLLRGDPGWDDAPRLP